MLDVLVVFVGGGIGSVARFLLTFVPWKTVGEAGFPLGTLVTNVAGSFLIGLIVAAAAPAGLSPRTTLLLKTGVCGGFTTFSTFALESADLMAQGQGAVALAYVLLSAALGIAACMAGSACARALLG